MLSIASKIIRRHFWNLYDYLKSVLLNDGNTHQSNDWYSRSNWSSRGSKTTKQEKKILEARKRTNRKLTEPAHSVTRNMLPAGGEQSSNCAITTSDITSPSFYKQVFTLKTTNTLVSNMYNMYFTVPSQYVCLTVRSFCFVVLFGHNCFISASFTLKLSIRF